MDMTILVQVGMAVAAVGFFITSYYRFSRPGRLNLAKDRRAPQLPAGAASGESGPDEARRLPTV